MIAAVPGAGETIAPTIAAAVRLPVRGELTETGTDPLERCIDPDPLFAELEKRGVRFEIMTAEEAPA